MRLAGLAGCVAIALGACNAELGPSPTRGEMPDAADPDEPSIAALCTEGYADVPGFRLCSAGDDACDFIALNFASCDRYCGARGGACIDASDNDVGQCDDFESDQGGVSCASTGKLDLVCRCTVP